jgi:hypothetical protein
MRGRSSKRRHARPFSRRRAIPIRRCCSPPCPIWRGVAAGWRRFPDRCRHCRKCRAPAALRRAVRMPGNSVARKPRRGGRWPSLTASAVTSMAGRAQQAMRPTSPMPRLGSSRRPWRRRQRRCSRWKTCACIFRFAAASCSVPSVTCAPSMACRSNSRVAARWRWSANRVAARPRSARRSCNCCPPLRGGWKCWGRCSAVSRGARCSRFVSACR